MPRGCSISVMIATVFLPAPLPISTISLARAKASSNERIKAPFPAFTSRTMASAPAAIFLLIILEAISGIESTVAVTSRRAYKALSAGTRLPDCPVTATPTELTMAAKRSGDSLVSKPGIDSSLSTVPPVYPSPRPDILATFAPQAATIGATISVVVSATPPVECLSTLMPGIADRSATSPECAIASVRATVSLRDIPEKQIAISRAEI